MKFSGRIPWATPRILIEPLVFYLAVVIWIALRVSYWVNRGGGRDSAR